MDIKLEKIKLDQSLVSEIQGCSIVRRDLGSDNQTDYENQLHHADANEILVIPINSNIPRNLSLKASLVYQGLEKEDVRIRASEVGNTRDEPHEFTVKFEVQKRVSVELSLDRRSLRSSEVGVNLSTWIWDYRRSGSGRWTEFAKTTQVVYFVIGPPTCPWTQNSPPSADVLQIACDWAAGATDEVNAATKITGRVYLLGSDAAGNKKLTYNRLPTYAHKFFNIQAFMKFLKGGVGKGQTVNCDDCATIVSTFANAIGCDLWQSAMGYDFHTNFIKLIGRDWEFNRGFPRHAVAWKDKCLQQNPLYDACLQVDGDGKPADQLGSHQALLPANLVFGNGSSKLYQFCLLRKGVCDPKTDGERIRRKIGNSHLVSNEFTSPEFLQFLKKHYRLDSFPLLSDRQASVHLANNTQQLIKAILNLIPFQGWTNLEAFDFEPENDLSAISQFLFKQKDSDKKLVELNLYEVAQAAAVPDFVLQGLAQFHQSDLRRLTTDKIGDLTFIDPDDTAVLFSHGDLLCIIRSVGLDQFSVFEMATAIADLLEVPRSTRRSSRPHQNREGESMTHKFAEVWSCFILTPGGLECIGKMDLRNMNEDGELRYGVFVDKHGEFYSLTGSASREGLPLSIDLLDEEGDRYQGVLTKEVNNDDGHFLIVVGTKGYADPKRRLLQARSQDDPPWIIVKP
jgi:hypothetical protein